MSILFLNFLLFFFYSFGFFYYRAIYKHFNQIIILKNYYYILPLIGFALLSIIFNYFYFLFNFSSFVTISSICILFFLSFLFINKKFFFYYFFKIVLKVQFIFILIVIFFIFSGEKFYIFRGNYWDSMNYISQAILINDFKFSEILNINRYSDYSYVDNGSQAIRYRPLTTFFLAQFFNFKIFNFFYNYALYKIFLITLTFLSFNFLSFILDLKNKFFFSIGFLFSFWLIYVLEIDSLSHLTVIPFFIFSIALLIQKKKSTNLKEDIDTAFFLLIAISFFFIYVEFFAIFFIIFVLFFLLKYKKKLLLINNTKFVLFSCIIFIAITAPLYFTTYSILLQQIKIGFRDDIIYWGYFSSFFIGKDNSFLTSENISFVKKIINEKNETYIIFKSLVNILLENKYYLIPLNLIPSFFGLYFLTISSLSNLYDLFFLFILIFLNYYLLRIFLINLFFIFKYSHNLFLLFKIFFFIFCFFFILLFLRNGYWQITKLYIYLSPIIFIFMSLNLKKKNNFIRIKLNNFYILLLLLFPLYKFSDVNYGIGRSDTFPSIINSKYKKNINWEANDSIFLKCTTIYIDSKDPIINGYLSIKLRYLGFKHMKSNSYTIENKNGNLKNCKVDILKTNFIIIYEKNS